MRKDQKAVWGWALYDWANSAFATTVMAGFFPVLFLVGAVLFYFVDERKGREQAVALSAD